VEIEMHPIRILGLLGVVVMPTWACEGEKTTAESEDPPPIPRDALVEPPDGASPPVGGEADASGGSIPAPRDATPSPGGGATPVGGEAPPAGGEAAPGGTGGTPLGGEAPVCVPSAEVCNGLDDDCDGDIDDAVSDADAPCQTALVGACAPGRSVCEAGALVCRGRGPAPEVCNGGDDDCDGQADEASPGVGERCDTGLSGTCSAGVRECVEGALTCVGGAMPVPERCNSFDDDCDERIDEDDGNGMACVGCQGQVPDAVWTGLCGEGALASVPNECADAEELHILGVYGTYRADLAIDVEVDRVGPPLVLVLSSYDAIEWRLALSPGVDLRQVIVNGYEVSRVVGAPADAEIVDRTGVGAYFEACGYALPSDGQGCETEQLVAGAEAFTGLQMTTFGGCYAGDRFTLGTMP